ncbi:MAG: 5-formyltetrahydrofolate cyclo-ligase [Pseudomonadota bacterium]
MTEETPKTALRRRAQQRRDALTGREGASTAACRHLVALIERSGDGAIASYLPIRSELDPRPAMTSLAENGRTVAVPVVVGAAQPLTFRAWQPGCRLVTGAFGVAVPEEGEAVTPDLLIVPLLAFDRAGYRLGYGGGFYDRTLERLRAAGPVVAIGVAFAAQEVDAVPREATDARLDAIVTEAGVIALSDLVGASG